MVNCETLRETTAATWQLDSFFVFHLEDFDKDSTQKLGKITEIF